VSLRLRAAALRGISGAMELPRLRSSFPLALAALLPLLGGCGGSKSDADKASATVAPVEDLYNNGIDALNSHRYDSATDQFNLVEQNYPYSTWAVNAQLMQGYTQYLRNNYTEAIAQLDRFIQLHPAHRDVAYAYYLRALCYYEQIADIQRDQRGTQDAMDALQQVVNRFPDSAYARDARLKIDLCRDHLAGKEMEIGRWYERQHLYEAAIGRFQRVVDDFQTTNHVPEALHRLTEIYLILGLKDQARKTAAVLGYNYPGSGWYEDSYNDLFDNGLVHEPGPPRAPERGFFARAWGSIF
jgi:outer membrane protein assembly factor BamD